MRYFMNGCLLSLMFVGAPQFVFSQDCPSLEQVKDEQIIASIESGFIASFIDHIFVMRHNARSILLNRKTRVTSFEREDDSFTFQGDINIKEEGPGSMLYFMGVEQEFSNAYFDTEYATTDYTLAFDFLRLEKKEQVCAYLFIMQEQTWGMGDWIMDDHDGISLVRLDYLHNIEELARNVGTSEEKKFILSIDIPMSAEPKKDQTEKDWIVSKRRQ